MVSSWESFTVHLNLQAHGISANRGGGTGFGRVAPIVMGLPGGGFPGAFANSTFSAELSCERECEKKEASGHRAVC